MSTPATCETCGEPFVTRSVGGQTLVGYGRDSNGHHHDDNCYSRRYFCKGGHGTKVSIRRRCEEPTPCDWVGRETCFCHPGGKVDAWPDAAAPLPTDVAAPW